MSQYWTTPTLCYLMSLGCSATGGMEYEEAPGPGLKYSSGAPEIGKIVDRNNQICSGTLIAPDIVLTAAHCTIELTPPLHYNIYSQDSARSWVFPISGLHHNPAYADESYTSSADGKYVHDVGLMVLGLPVPGNVARPRAMSNESPPPGTHMTVWGYSSASGYELWKKHYADFQWPDKTSVVWYGDSGGPVIRGDNGSIVRVVSGILQNVYVAIDLSAPLSANWDWLQTTLNQLQDPAQNTGDVE